MTNSPLPLQRLPMRYPKHGLHGDRQGAAGGAVVHALPRAVVPASTWGTLCRRCPRRRPVAPGVRPFRSRGEATYRESEDPRGSLTEKNLTQVRQILFLKGSKAVRIEKFS